jgi:hypothetical protein
MLEGIELNIFCARACASAGKRSAVPSWSISGQLIIEST